MAFPLVLAGAAGFVYFLRWLGIGFITYTVVYDIGVEVTAEVLAVFLGLTETILFGVDLGPWFEILGVSDVMRIIMVTMGWVALMATSKLMLSLLPTGS